MEEPKKFAGRVVHAHGRTTKNDFPQPDKFFADMKDFLYILDGVPLKAVEELEKYEMNREVMVNVIKRCMLIMKKANLDLLTEIKRLETDQFEGLEDDLKLKKGRLKVSGEEGGK